MSGFDQQLQDEILNDIKRNDEGKPPLFVEQLGQEEQSGAFKYGVGVEAAMPPVIGEPDMDDDDADDATHAGAATAADDAKTREQREADELAEAQAWFAEKDKKYFHHTEMDSSDQVILGHTGMPQRRELTIGYAPYVRVCLRAVYT